MNEGRFCHAKNQKGEKIFIVSGRKAGTWGYLEECESFDLEKKEMKKIQSTIQPAENQGIFNSGERVFCLGDWCGWRELDKIIVLETRLNEWTELGLKLSKGTDYIAGQKLETEDREGFVFWSTWNELEENFIFDGYSLSVLGENCPADCCYLPWWPQTHRGDVWFFEHEKEKLWKFEVRSGKWRHELWQNFYKLINYFKRYLNLFSNPILSFNSKNLMIFLNFISKDHSKSPDS